MMRIPDITEYPDETVIEDIEGGTITHECYCCSCGLAHTCIIKIKRGKAHMTAERRERATAQMRRHGNVELLNGEDPKWKMIKK